MTWRSQVGVVALAAVMVAGCSSSTGSSAEHGASSSPATSTSATGPQPVPLGVEAPIGDVPWSQVGPGWTLAMWSPAPGTYPGSEPPPGEPTYQTATKTLYLVDPAGGRYAITTFPPPGEDGPDAGLADWSGDGRHALLRDYDYNAKKTTFTEVDLTSGAKPTFTVDGEFYGTYSRPTGQAIFLSMLGFNAPATLKRVDLSGKEQLTFPTDQLGPAGKYTGDYLASRDGTQLVLGTAHGLVMMGNDGVLGRQLPVPEPYTVCSPVRWWTSTVILARCSKASSAGGQLWRVPVDGGPPTALTAFNSGNDPAFGPDLGDATAWQLSSGTFVQSLGACGSMFLSRLTPDMHTTKVDVPGVDNGKSIVVMGATADKLLLQATLSCGSGVALLTFDPAANISTVLLGPPVNGGGVIASVPYPRD